MAQKETGVIPQKAVRLSTDAYIEDSELISQIMADLNLDSRKEALHILCNRYRDNDDDDLGNSEDGRYRCDFRIKDVSGLFCVEENYQKPKKITVEKCRVCLKAQKIEKRQNELAEIKSFGESMRYDMYIKTEYTFFKKLGVPVDEVHNGIMLFHSKLDLMSSANQLLDKQNAELQELKKPIEEKLLELTNLKAEKVSLETDNAYLRQQLDELKRDSLFQENAWFRDELKARNKEIEQLKTEISQKTAIPNIVQGATQ